jgi:diguanylate cyclase (GGDEF)-like protein/PAS domain S-box-containing protein
VRLARIVGVKSFTPGHAQRFRLEWVAITAIVSIIGAVIFTALYREFDRTQALEADRLQVQARVVDDMLVRQIEGVDRALEGVRKELARNAGVPSERVSEQLRLLSEALPGVRTMAIIDAAGSVVASSRAELIGRQFRDRALFDIPRQGANPETLYVSAPFASPLGGSVIAMGRVVIDAGGRVAGLVGATLDPEYFSVVLGSVLYAPDMRSTLMHAQGKIFLSMPHHAPVDGTPDDGNRMTATRTVNSDHLRIDRPLVAVVSRDTSAVYADWRTKAWRYSAFVLCIVVAMVWGLSFSQRRRQAFDRLADAAAAERQRSADRLELALRGADLGLWDIHIPTNDLIANARELAMLGYEAQGEIPAGMRWHKLVHPDDRPAMKAAIERHLRGDSEAYECEHRLQHRDGHWIWVFARGMVAERDAAGAPIRMVGTHLDITAARQADAELARTADLLRRSEEQLRQVTDHLPLLVSTIDMTQRYRFANRAYRDWLGIEPDSLLGRRLQDVHGEATYAGMRHHVETALAGTPNVHEREMATPRGPCHVEVTLIPQRNPDGSMQGVLGLVHDLTERYQAELQRARSEERLSLALEGSGLALFDWDIVNDRIHQSAQAAAMRGDPAVESDSTAKELQGFVHPDDLAPTIARIRDALRGATPLYHAEFRIRKRSGAWLWIRARGRVVERDATGRAIRLAGTYADINDRKVSESRLRHMAEFDSLTDLPNRAQFLDRLQTAMQRTRRADATALLFLDIDHFKTINDTLGHEAGDQLLKVFAQRMRASVRQSDLVARLAGDEFTIILEDLREGADAEVIAAKLVESLREPIALAGRFYAITTSVGIALCVPGETDDAALLRRADAALYEAKRRGRDGYFRDEAMGPDRQAASVAGATASVIH